MAPAIPSWTRTVPVRRLLRAVPVLLLCATAGSAGAADPAPAVPPLAADRPLQTYGATTVPAGRVQNEFGYTHQRRAGETLDSLGEWVVRWGLWRDFELNLLVGGYRWLDAPEAGGAEGWTDGRLGLKWTSQHGAGPRPTAALLLGTSLPTGQAPFREDTLQPEAVIAMAWSLGGGVRLGSNVGWGWGSRDLERFHRWWGSVALSVDLGGRFGAFAEAYGYRREEPGGAGTGYLDAGITCGLGPDFQLDARAGLGRNGLDEDWFASLGAAWRIHAP
jgi:hypothetical protein